jgi:choice-of-anchor B domain-containing protein
MTRRTLVVVLSLFALAGVPAPDPPIGSHCDCNGGICRLDRYGRACSCGCAMTADLQRLQDLEPVFDAPCVEGMTGPFPCRDVDLLAFLPHSTIGGGNGNDVWGWTDPETGREYAIVGRTRGTAFVDITNPRQPVYLGELPTQTVDSIWRGIKVFAHHAFIVSEAVDHGMQVFDLTQLRNVAAPPARFTASAHYAGFGSTHTLAINTQTGFAYATGTRTCQGGLHIVDIRLPASPKPAGCFSFDGYTHETQCVLYSGPDETYRGREICFNSNEDTLTIVDVTEKDHQVQVSRTGYDGSAYTHQGWLTQDHGFFLVNDEGDERAFKHPTRTWIWDVRDLDQPVLSGKYDGPAAAIDHNLYIRGNLVYESNYRSGLRILDATEIESGTLREVGFLDVYPEDDEPAFNGTWTSYPFFNSGAVAVNGIEQGLFVVRPRAEPRGHPTGLSVTIGEPGDPMSSKRDWLYVVTASNHGPERLDDVRVTEMPAASAQILSAQPTQGRCTIGSIATCDLGALAPGSEAVIIVTVRVKDEGDYVSTAIARGRTADGTMREASALVTTRGVEHSPRLELRRPDGDTTFLSGRNNTVQWTLRGVDGGVQIELSRNDGVNWITLAADAPNTGFFDWLATGPSTVRARLRVTSLERSELTQTSPGFAIITR